MGTELLNVVKNEIDKKFNNKKLIEQAGKTIETGMSLFGTDMDRSTHYNTIDELNELRVKIHDQVFTQVGRSIYGCLMCIPGVSDYSKMTAVTKLLSNPWHNQKDLLTMDDERNIIDHIVSSLPPNRMINLFLSFEGYKVNNKRTLNTVLPFILNSPNLEWWSVKYKNKLKLSISHCWGKKMSSVVSTILGKNMWTEKDKTVLKNHVDKYLVNNKPDYVHECLAFIFSSWDAKVYKLNLFKKYQDAKIDFSKAEGLPKEIIEGIRACYHPNIDKIETLKVAQKSMTSKEKKLVQNQAKKAGVEIKWDPYAQPLVDLLIYGFQMGFNTEINVAIGQKAKTAASLLPFKYDTVGILCDDSFSMSGSEDQKLRALAVAYATVEMLKRVSNKAYYIATTSGRDFYIHNPPIDASDLTTPLIKLLKQKPDVIFVVSDGYENAPEGRFNEVVKIINDKLELNIPIYHFNPVSSAESKVALKKLSNDIPLTPVSNPEQMGLTLFKTMLVVDPRGGIMELFNMILPQVEKSKDLYARKAITERKKDKEIA